MAFIPSSNSVVAFQSDPTKLVGTVSIVGNMNSSVTAFQGTSPWIINQPSPSIIAYQAAGSVMAISGSFSAGNTSVTAFQGGTWGASVTGTMSVLGTVPVTHVTSPWIINMPSPSIIATQLAGSVMAVSGSFTANPQSSIIALQLAGSIMAVNATVNTGNSSVQLLGGVAVIGSVAVLQSTNPWLIGNSSVQTIQGTTPWVVGSIIATIQGSVAAGITTLNAATVATDIGNTNTVTMRMVQATGSTYNTGQVIIASSATSILGVNVNRIRAIITNVGTNAVYLGNSSGVTSITGALLAGIAGYPFMTRVSASVWGTSPAGNQIVTFLEEVK